MLAWFSKKENKTHGRQNFKSPADLITQVAKPNTEKTKTNRGGLFDMSECFSMLKRCIIESTPSFSSNKKESISLLGPQPEHLKGRKTLILDLDETLAHSTLDYIRSPDFVLSVMIKGVSHLISILKRPGVEDFLNRAGQLFEVVIFTASLEEYAKPLVRKIDKNNNVSAFLYREACTFFKGALVKDLSKLGRDLKDVILIDNSANSFAFQPENAYHIKDFFDDKTDQELPKLSTFLEYLAQVDDVRSVPEHLKNFEQLQATKEGSGNTIPSNTTDKTQASELAPLHLDTKDSARPTFRSPIMRSDTETTLLHCESEVCTGYTVSSEEKEALRVVKALSMRQKIILEDMRKSGLMGPVARATSSSTSAGSGDPEDKSSGDPSPFKQRDGIVEAVEAEIDDKRKLHYAKMIGFPDIKNKNYMKFECENEEGDDEEECNATGLRRSKSGEEFHATSPIDAHTLHNILAKERRMSGEIY